jgi:hypothetical protein
MRKKTFAAAVVAAVACACAGAASAAGGSGWSEWQPYRSQPYTYAAGDVCAFPVSVAFPVDREQMRSRTDASGHTIYEVTGALFTRVTNLDTGASVVRNISGKGFFDYAPDGSFALEVQGHAMSGFHAGDTPAHELLVFSGNTVVSFAPDGSRSLTQQQGTAEDLCRTLAG